MAGTERKYMQHPAYEYAAQQNGPLGHLTPTVLNALPYGSLVEAERLTGKGLFRIIFERNKEDGLWYGLGLPPHHGVTSRGLSLEFLRIISFGSAPGSDRRWKQELSKINQQQEGIGS